MVSHTFKLVAEVLDEGDFDPNVVGILTTLYYYLWTYYICLNIQEPGRSKEDLMARRKLMIIMFELLWECHRLYET